MQTVADYIKVLIPPAKDTDEKPVKPVKAIQSVCELTQTVGGFDVNTDVPATLEYLQVNEVYKRLRVLATDNLVAVSELIRVDLRNP
jgi:hypothetical protein